MTAVTPAARAGLGRRMFMVRLARSRRSGRILGVVVAVARGDTVRIDALIGSAFPARSEMKRLTREARARLMRRGWRVERQRTRASREPLCRGQLPRLSVGLEGNVDLIDNPDDTRAQLAAIDRAVDRSRSGPFRTFVDLSKASSFDPCALLYLAAQLDTMKVRGCRISGNYPHSDVARRALSDAGFERFMGSKEPLRSFTGAPEIELRRGNRSTGSRPRDWAPLHKFIKAHGHLTDDEADAFYAAFGECVENVVQHAYHGRYGRWYALAIRPTGRPARAVVLDLGVGIPSSIRKDPADWFQKAFGKQLSLLRWAWRMVGGGDEDDADYILAELVRLTAFDWTCVHLATLGRRTETGELKRGKGLSDLRKVVLEQKGGTLHVLSGAAAVTWTYGEEPRRTNFAHLKGTIVCLELGSATPAKAIGASHGN